MKKPVKNQICQTCGADIRTAALFCYSCGSSVASDLLVETKDVKNNGKTDGRLGENISTKNGENNLPGKVKIIKKPIEEMLLDIPVPIQKPLETLGRPSAETKRTNTLEHAKLKSAGALRRKSRTPQRKTIEVIWEEPENKLNIWFVIAAGVLMLFAVAILLAMLYIR